MMKNMVHDVDAYDTTDPDPENWGEVTLFDVMCSGIPSVTPDQKVFGTYTTNVWDYDDENYYYSYIIFADKNAGVSAMPAAKFDVKAFKGGIVRIEGTEATVEVFNTAGAKVFSTRATGDIATNLEGLYIVRATAADGTVKTLKATF